MIDFLRNLLFKSFNSKIVKGFPTCEDCPPPEPDCTNPCGCDNGGGGGCGGGGPDGFRGPGGEISMEDDVAEFLAVGQQAPEGGELVVCPVPQPDPPKCQECSGSGGVNNGAGTGVCITVTTTY